MRTVAAEVMRFVRGAQGMTQDEQAWFIERIEPIISSAIAEAREACARIAESEALPMDEASSVGRTYANATAHHIARLIRARGEASRSVESRP